MYNFKQLEQELLSNQKTWLVTGAAGFIGSNIVEKLLLLNQKVVGVDNFISGHMSNISDLINNTKLEDTENFRLVEADVTNKSVLDDIFNTYIIDFVTHQAALSSVHLSIKNPELFINNNVNGFRNILELCADYKIKSLVYASSSSVYGDNSDINKVESRTGKRLSPYADSKHQNEQDAIRYNKEFDLNVVGLRYFNVYGKRQDPNGAYAAVIPKWIETIFNNQELYINGDGSTTRDFCHIDDVVKANILACFNFSKPDNNLENSAVINIGYGKPISLKDLYSLMIAITTEYGVEYKLSPEYRNFLDGDIRHSCANIKLAGSILNFVPEFDLERGISQLINWQVNQHEKCLSTKL